jgi:hypothetical protein
VAATASAPSDDFATAAVQTTSEPLLLRTVGPNGRNPPKISSPDGISRVFSTRCQQVYFYFRFRDCLRFRFKICQITAGTSMISRFHEFFNIVFGGILLYGPIYVALKLRARVQATRSVSSLFVSSEISRNRYRL